MIRDVRKRVRQLEHVLHAFHCSNDFHVDVVAFKAHCQLVADRDIVSIRVFSVHGHLVVVLRQSALAHVRLCYIRILVIARERQLGLMPVVVIYADIIRVSRFDLVDIVDVKDLICLIFCYSRVVHPEIRHIVVFAVSLQVVVHERRRRRKPEKQCCSKQDNDKYRNILQFVF